MPHSSGRKEYTREEAKRVAKEVYRRAKGRVSNVTVERRKLSNEAAQIKARQEYEREIPEGNVQRRGRR